MNGKDYGLLMESHGANASAFAVVLQKLRGAFKVSVSGRGFNAHDLTDLEMACTMAAYAGSEVAARAAETLDRLLKLRAPVDESRGPSGFIECFQFTLRREVRDVREIRVFRNADFAEIVFEDGFVRTFVNWRSPRSKPPLFRSEGVISAGLIAVLADNVVLEEDQGFAGDAIEADELSDD